MSKTQTWKASYSAKPIFTAEQIKNITKEATRWQKLKLCFIRSHYSSDGDSVIRYKIMDDKYYIMKKGTKLP